MLRSTTFRSGNPAPRSTPDDAPHHRKTLKPYGNMKNYSAKEIKNIVLIGAPGTGKTTLAEAMAFEGKVIDRRGSIEANNTLSDNTDIEHEYKRSIYSTILFTEFMDRKLNIIDCPGSDDFCGSLFSAFKVGDVGVFLFNAQNGWEVGSEIQARYARLLKKPVIGVVNQLDAEKANFEATIESIRAASRVKPVIVQYPVNQGPEFNAFIDVLLMKMYRFKDNDGHREELEIPAEEIDKAQELNKELVEMAAEHDEALMELYFDKGTLTQDDIRAGLKIGVSKREVMPIFCTSGKRDIGTKRLMEFIINVAPGPLKAPCFLSTEGEEIAAAETAPAVAFVFKSQVEQHIGEITYFRVIRGRIAEGTELVNTRTGNKEKISQLFAVAGKNRIKVTELSAGDIGCTVKLKGTRTNDTLSAPSAPVSIEPIVFPEPRYRAAVKAKEQSDEEKLGKVLNDAKFEDPTILVEYSKELKQTIIQGQGEHHLNILRTRIEKENKLSYDYMFWIGSVSQRPQSKTHKRHARAQELQGSRQGRHDREPQDQGRIRPGMGRQIAILLGDRGRRHRRTLHARHPEGYHGEDGRRPADGFLRPRHPRGGIRRKDAPGGFERNLLQTGGAQRLQGGFPQRGAQDHGADLQCRDTRPERLHGRRDVRLAEPPCDDRRNGVRQGLRPSERHGSAG